MIGENIMKKVLSTVLILSLLVGFSVSVASFASEENSEVHGLITEEEYYESLTDEDVGNDRVKLTFNPEEVQQVIAKELLEGFPLDRQQLGRSPFYGWARVGDILYYFFRLGADEKYWFNKIIPLFCDEFGRACDSKGKPIRVIKIPDYVNGHPVTNMGKLTLYELNEYFQDLECVILPKTLESVHSELSLHPRFGRSLKIYVPRGTNCRYDFDKEGIPPLQPGLHVMLPQNMVIS